MSDTWKPPFSYDLEGDGSMCEVAVLSRPTHIQGDWVKIEDYRALERERNELRAFAQWYRDQFGGQVPEPGCDCGDCETLLWVDRLLGRGTEKGGPEDE